MQFSTKNLALLAAAASLSSAAPTQNKVEKRSFNAAGGNNLAVWWGNSNKLTPLKDICADKTSDIVILTFATGFSGGKWTLAGNTAAPEDIKACQSAGKKVFMSIGGETGSLSWASDDAATTAAKAAAKQFYDEMGLDGVDLDIENKQPAHWDTFAKALKTSGKLISAAPQCITPDASLPFNVLDNVDHVWVQFYNNPSCGHGSTGFLDSVKDWASKTKGQFWIAGPGSADSAGSGYLDAAGIAKEIESVKALGLKNFGGYALWDASTAKANGDYGAAIKKALGGSSGPAPSSNPKPTSAKPTATASQTGKVQATGTGSGATETVKATSTAHVTSTAFSGATSTPVATPVASATPAPSNGTAPSGSGCTTDGALVCSADGTQFGLCVGGQASMMALAAGTKCVGGNIVAADSA